MLSSLGHRQILAPDTDYRDERLNLKKKPPPLS